MRALIAFAAATAAIQSGAPGPVAITVVNPIAIARPSETISLPAADLLTRLAVKDVRDVQVRDARLGTDLLTQAVDVDDDGTFDELIFQADLAPGETRAFTATAGAADPEALRVPRLRPVRARAARRFRVGKRPRRAPHVRHGPRDLGAGAADE